MFRVGERVIYGINGVCEIESVGILEMAGMPKDKEYYTLLPVFSNRSKVFAPVDNTRIVMREVISKSEAMDLLNKMPSLEELVITSEKTRENEYKEAIKSCDCYTIAKMIKTIRHRMRDRIAEGKRVTSNDEKYIRLAEDKLLGELSVSLEMDREEIRNILIEGEEKIGA